MNPANQTAMFETMLRIRRFEEAVRDSFSDGEIPGFVHLYIGEEAIASGVCFALDEDDYITSTHRGHGHCIAKGLEPARMMAELFGKDTGYCHGKGGSMHIADFDSGMLGANAIVGASGPIAAGAGLTASMRGNERVVVCFFGDGALAQGPLHEAMNLAAVWDLPVLFVCENNQYGEMTPTGDQHGISRLADRGKAYGMPSVHVNGMDVEEVFEAGREAVERARTGNGPTFLECEAYRFRGHFEGDPETYRSEEEVEEWQRKDPVHTYRSRLIERDVMTETEIDELEQSVQREIEQAVDFARTSSPPGPAEAYTDVSSEPEGSSR